ncbi:hypothetical protein FB451DRAFT_1562354 [Mycena latifolia]|nr:hypothetical protein FB451DRAFT_1562354 [Mycena latifolia]
MRNLPSLVALEITGEALPLGPRLLERIQVHIALNTAKLASLRSFAQTLTTLTIVQHLSTSSVVNIVNAVTGAVPDILHLNITQPLQLRFPPVTPGDSLIPLFARFQRVQSFVLQVRKNPRNSITWEAERFIEWKPLGRAIMHTSETLLHVEIGISAALGTERAYIFRRAEPGGDILCVEEDGFQWDVTSDFWSA